MLKNLSQIVDGLLDAYDENPDHYTAISRDIERYAGLYKKHNGSLKGFGVEEWIKLSKTEMETFVILSPYDIMLFKTRPLELVDICIYVLLLNKSSEENIIKLLETDQWPRECLQKRIKRIKLFN